MHRTLLHAALRSCIIQYWWRQRLKGLLEKKRSSVLENYTREKWAVIKLQSWVLMWHTRLCYCRLLQAARIIQVYWRWHNCQAHGFFRGHYDLTASHLGLELDIFLGSHICWIMVCIPFPIKNWSGRLQHSVTRPLSDKLQFSSVQLLSLCDPMDYSTPGLLVHKWLLEFTQYHVHWVVDAIQPSHPLSSSSPLAFNLSQHQGLFKWVSSSNQVAKVLEFQLQHQSFQWIFRTDFL